MMRKTNYKTSGFTLVELLVVLVIMSILVGLFAYSFNSLTAPVLTNTGNAIVSELVNAQQRAINDSAHVEVRFYQPDDFDNDQTWVILLVREISEDTYKGLSTPFYLPQELIFSHATDLSTLIGLPDVQTDSEELITAENGDPKYTAFRFNSNGSTNLDSVATNSDSWHITLIPSGGVDGSDSTPPNNFFTISIDPSSGSVKTFGP